MHERRSEADKTTGTARFALDVDDLEVYQLAYELTMEIFNSSRTWPRTEQYSLTNQVLRSSRSVCANLAEAWRKRRYEGDFKYTLSIAHAESDETATWLKIAFDSFDFLNDWIIKIIFY